MADYFDWSEQTVFKLRELWIKGITTPEIGRQLGCSKSAVISAARRYGCAPRENAGGWKNKHIVKEAEIVSMIRDGKTNETISKLLHVSHQRVASLRLAHPGPPTVRQRRDRRIVSPPRPTILRAPMIKRAENMRHPDDEVAPRPPPFWIGRIDETTDKPCVFPQGDPKEKGFRYCDQPSILGRPYCKAHCLICFTNIRFVARTAA